MLTNPRLIFTKYRAVEPGKVVVVVVGRTVSTKMGLLVTANNYEHDFLRLHSCYIVKNVTKT
jgi:hypothetical protein